MAFRFFKPQIGASSGASSGNSDQKPPATPDAKRRVAPVHPILFASFPILALFVQNAGQVSLWQLARPFGWTLLGTFVAWTLFLLITRHVRKAAIAASAIVVAFFSYGHTINLLPHALRPLAVPVGVLVVGALLIALLKTRRPLLDATAILNFMSVVLIAAPVWTICTLLLHPAGAGKSSHADSENLVMPLRHHVPTAISPPRHLIAASPNLPDVYYIILDAYGRADRLKQFYGYDNSPFIEALTRRGFYIPPHSRANYDQTPLCLASALSMNYLDYPQNEITPEFLRQLVDDNAVAAALRKFGYRYVSIWSGLDVSLVTTADVALNRGGVSDRFAGQALSLTPLGANAGAQNGDYNQHRRHLLGVFNNLDEVAQLPSPKFVFAHALAPHPPFVLGANGEAVYPKGPLTLDDASWLLKDITKEEYRRGYIAQLQYVNKRVIGAVDAILRQSRRPPIIIIQGDHGSRMNLDWDSLANTDVREPFSIFNAYRVPTRVRGALYDTITPVNSFRVLLSTLYGAKYPLLPDRSFYSGTAHPYDFTEVTHRIRE